jgi:hypothetical protein
MAGERRQPVRVRPPLQLRARHVAQHVLARRAHHHEAARVEQRRVLQALHILQVRRHGQRRLGEGWHGVCVAQGRQQRGLAGGG